MLLTRQRAKEVFSKVIKYSTADETEALISSTTYSLTRFANNTIHQNVAEEGGSLSVRAVADKRTARASTNQFDEASIRQVCEAAIGLARLQPPDPDLLPMPGPQTYRSVDRFDLATSALSPQARAETVRNVIGRAEKENLTAAGVYSSGARAVGIFNSRGLATFHEETVSEFSVTMLDESSSGWAKKTSPESGELEPEVLAERAARKALESREPREIPPGSYTVILESAAVLDLLGFLFFDFGGLAVHEKRSCLTDRLGQKIFGENINVRDDVYHPLQAGEPFDGEGMPRRRVTLVEKGVVKNVVYARQTAHKVGAEATGHGFPLPNEFGEAPMNIVMDGGRASLEDMIASTERGLLVTRLWYIREVDPYQKILTGMTRDGTFWIENGKVQYGVKNFRFNQSVIAMLEKVEMMGPPQRTAGEESFEMVVPAMKVRDFSFSSLTKF
ncbi:MAG: TldD/PmbA family protein [Acidobacteria bacterium]|nr:TldD/PmbA family protein [Acidobacteriota bacterium]